MKTQISILLMSIMLLVNTACDKEEAALQTLFTGPKTEVGDGMAWTIIETNAAQQPIAIGVQFDEAALSNLPTGSMHADEFTLSLPQELSVAPYDHVTLDWNEHGHEPMHVYDKPHFDIHFYMMSHEQRDQIGPDDEEAFNRPLAAPYLPPNYLETPGGVPRMGAHIIDLTSPEIEGSGEFAYTFIYGKYDGEINFLEPMVTKAYLERKTAMTKAISQPQSWQRSGYYPENYSISYDEQSKVYSIKMTDLTKY